MHTDGRVRFLDVDFDTMTMDGALAWLAERSRRDHFAYVVTPNVDHLVRLHGGGPRAASLVMSYARAALCLCDSRVLQRLARLCGLSLPLVPGSDLTAALFERVIDDGEEVAIVGGTPELLGRLQRRFPNVIFHQHIPPMGLADKPGAIAEAAEFVASSGARFALLAVGSPQQEMVAMNVAERRGAAGTALCVGASLDFIAGIERRAPRWARRAGLEWAHRLAAQPRRMWRRYLVEGPRIFAIAWRWRRATGRAK